MTQRAFARLHRVTDEEYQADDSGRFWPRRAAVRYCQALLDKSDTIADKEAFASTELYKLAVEGAERLAIAQPWLDRRLASATK